MGNALAARREAGFRFRRLHDHVEIILDDLQSHGVWRAVRAARAPGSLGESAGSIGFLGGGVVSRHAVLQAYELRLQYITLPAFPILQDGRAIAK